MLTIAAPIRMDQYHVQNFNALFEQMFLNIYDG